MYLYNITIKVDWSIHEDWLVWMKNEHEPYLLSTNSFSKCTLLRLKQIDEEDGPTYALQLFAESKALYNHFVEKYLLEMNSKQKVRWGEKMLGFTTLMEIVH